MANVYTISNEALNQFLAELQTSDTKLMAQQFEEFLSKHLTPKAKRGRPSKKTPAADENPVVEEVSKDEEKPKKKRGRPSKKNPDADEKPVVEEVSKDDEKPKKERKPRKEKEEVNAGLWGDLEEREFTRMNFQEGSSDKFWECAQEGNVTLVRYGKTGTKGTLQQKTFEDEEAASKFLEKEILGKEKKGYIRA